MKKIALFANAKAHYLEMQNNVICRDEIALFADAK